MKVPKIKRVMTKRDIPRLVNLMVSDSHTVMGRRGWDLRSDDGDLIEQAFAKNFINTLYSLGFFVAEKAGKDRP